MLHPEYMAYLDEGEHENRFSLIFSKYDLRYQPDQHKTVYVYSFRNRLFIYLNLPEGEPAELAIHNMVGQELEHQRLQGNGYREMDMDLMTGIYIVTIRSANEVYTKKVYFNNQW